MPDENQGQPNDDGQGQQGFEREQAHGREVMAQQSAEIEQAKTLAAQQKDEAEQAAAEAEEAEWEEAEFTARLNAAKNGDKYAAPNGEGQPSPEDIQKLLKKIAPLDKKIREDMKKTGNEYFTIYLFLLLLAGMLDIIGLLADITVALAWLNLILGPVYGGIRYLGINYTYMGTGNKDEEMKKVVTTTLVSGLISSFGLPARTVSMIGEFTVRREMATKAAQAITRSLNERKKVLGPALSQQYPAPKR